MADTCGVSQFIAGQWRAGTGRQRISIEDPATNNPLANYSGASVLDLEKAVASAEKGLKEWSSTPVWNRQLILLKTGELLRERCESIARSITIEQGKLLKESRDEVLRAADFFTWAAGEAVRTYERIVPSRSEELQRVSREPIGVVCAFTPWNYPIILVAKKVAAALAAGCAIILKPSEETPSGACALVQACLDAGLPADALNLVLGEPSEISEFLISHPAVRKITFTGSTSVGKILAAKASALMKSSTMELGGHAPVIIADDVDIPAVVEQLVVKKYHNAGQACISPTRFFVQSGAYHDFIEAFAEKARSIKIGSGLDESSGMGPLANARRLKAVRELIHDATARGSELVTGGNLTSNAGNFLQPTVLSCVDDLAIAMNEEPFGPLALFSPYNSPEEAIFRANRLDYGLAAYAFTSNPKLQDYFQRELQAGLVGINTTPGHVPEIPLGGWKDSGMGLEGGAEALDAYLINKLISRKSS